MVSMQPLSFCHALHSWHRVHGRTCRKAREETADFYWKPFPVVGGKAAWRRLIKNFIDLFEDSGGFRKKALGPGQQDRDAKSLILTTQLMFSSKQQQSKNIPQHQEHLFWYYIQTKHYYSCPCVSASLPWSVVSTNTKCPQQVH